MDFAFILLVLNLKVVKHSLSESNGAICPSCKLGFETAHHDLLEAFSVGFNTNSESLVINKL